MRAYNATTKRIAELLGAPVCISAVRASSAVNGEPTVFAWKWLLVGTNQRGLSLIDKAAPPTGPSLNAQAQRFNTSKEHRHGPTRV